MRNNADLQALLDQFLVGEFQDALGVNPIQIKFGRKALRRFGSIKMDRARTHSLITINGHFRDERIPVEVIQATLAHELCHFVHGFGSKLPKKYAKPHQGGVIKKEMHARGILKLYNFEKKWSKANWPQILGPLPARRRISRKQPTLKSLIKSLILG